MSKLTQNKVKKRVVLIDADGLLYGQSLKGETLLDGKQIALLDPVFVARQVMKDVERIVEATEADSAFIALTHRNNFRMKVMPAYKQNRKGKPRPILLDAVRKLIIEQHRHPVLLIDGLEADDVVGIMAGKLQQSGKETVIASPDKDLLQIPGFVYRGGKCVWVSLAEADDWHYYQMMVGDIADGYKGLPGVGHTKACKLIAQFPNKFDLWKHIVSLYEEKGLTEAEALVQARVSRMTRLTDWDADKKEVILWNPPTE